MRVVNNSDPKLYLKYVSEDQSKDASTYYQWNQRDMIEYCIRTV